MIWFDWEFMGYGYDMMDGYVGLRIWICLGDGREFWRIIVECWVSWAVLLFIVSRACCAEKTLYLKSSVSFFFFLRYDSLYILSFVNLFLTNLNLPIFNFFFFFLAITRLKSMNIHQSIFIRLFAIQGSHKICVETFFRVFAPCSRFEHAAFID